MVQIDGRRPEETAEAQDQAIEYQTSAQGRTRILRAELQTSLRFLLDHGRQVLCSCQARQESPWHYQEMLYYCRRKCSLDY